MDKVRGTMQKKLNDKIRKNNLDFIRGLAMCLVIIGHAIDLLLQKNIMDRSIGQKIYDIIYTFHMPVIFSISGYLNYNSEVKSKKISSIIFKEVLSLYIPYLFINIVYWCERYVAYAVLGVTLTKDMRFSIKSIVELLYIGDGLTWFLLSLMLIRLITNIFRKYSLDMYLTIMYIVLFLMAYLGYGGTVVYYLSWGLFFWIGYMINKCQLEDMKKCKRTGAFLAAFCVMMLGIFLYTKVGLNAYVKLLIGEGLFVVFILITQNMPKIKVINFCGEHSIVLYCMHGVTQYITYMFGSSFVQNCYLLIVVMLMSQIVITWFVYVIMTRFKLFKWVEVLFYPCKYILL